jgi:hypothetical protein
LIELALVRAAGLAVIATRLVPRLVGAGSPDGAAIEL